MSDRAVLTVVDALERVKEERDTLRLRLAAVERERDEARAQVIQRDGDTTPAGFWGRTAARIAKERDAAIQRATAAEARCAQVEAETVAGIVAYLRGSSCIEWHESVRHYAIDTLSDAASFIEAGAWRGKEGA